ncbi:B12-binding domain-containing radical SAM protein [Veillonella caviae]|uniref:B12-binding domain-containing radical SAM protein n=1 Tax=Veillonella caviae TaxID=248316 RepID=UPI002A915655|nr:radical SAM protein [Veillonella caviae]MDY6225234.1 radical SAM protein [Veillonella caviae]
MMRDNDILFFNIHRRYLNSSPQFGGFLGIFILAAFLNQNGYRAQSYAGQLMESMSLIDEACSNHGVKMIGLYCDYENVTEVIFLSKYIKDTYGIPVIVGGPQATNLKEEFYIQSKCDFVVRYEGEITVLDLANFCIEGTGSIEDIKGISYFNNNDIVIHQEQELIENLDELPFIDDECYLVPRDNHSELSVMTGRGCPFHCSFCHEGHHTRKVRLRSVQSVLQEIESYIKIHSNVREFHILFTDDTFTLISERVRLLCEGLKELQKIKPFKWFCEGHIHTLFLNPEMIKYIADAGGQRIQLGIEAGTQEVLDAYRKGSTLDEIRYVVRECYEKGIDEVYSNIILAGAYFNSQVHKKNIEFAKELLTIAPGVMDIGVVSYWPLPETTITNNPESYGLHIIDYDFYTASGDFPQIETDEIDKWELVRMIQYMENDIAEYMKQLLLEDKIDIKLIEKWLKTKKPKYFSRWMYILNQLPHIYNYYSMIISKECLALEAICIDDLTINPMRTVQLSKYLKIEGEKYLLFDQEITKFEMDILIYSLGKLSINDIIVKLSQNYAISEIKLIENVKLAIVSLAKRHLLVFSRY